MIDVAVIGGGPAGLSAALNAKIRDKSVKLFSKGINNLSRAKRVDNYLGFNDIEGKTLISQFYKHLEQHEIKPDKNRIISIIPFSNEYFMINAGNDIVKARTVILATGVQRKNDIPGEDDFLGRGVSYCATCDGALYVNKNVVLWGFSDESAIEANFLYDIGAKVTFISKPEYQTKLNKNIKVIEGSILEIKGKENVEYIVLKSGTMKTDAVFILRENISVQKLITSLKMEGNYIKVNNKMMTNIPGVFAAGDCIGKPLQVAKAVSDGLIAAQSAVDYLDRQQLER